MNLIRQVRPFKIFSLLTFFLIPFLGGNHLSIYYVTIDKFWIETTFVLLLLFAILVQFFGKGVDSVKKNTAINPFVLFFLPFFAVNALSLVYTWNTYSTLNELNTLVWILGTVYLFSITENKEALIKAIIIGASLSAVCMIVQSKVLFPKLFELSMPAQQTSILSERVVPFSSFINESPLGGFFLTLFPISLYFAVLKKNYMFMASSVLILFGVAFSMSRIAIIFAALCLIIILIFLIKAKTLPSENNNKNKNFKTRIFIFIGIIISTAMLFAFFTYGNLLFNKQNKTMKRIQERITYRLKNVTQHISSLDARTEIWSIGKDAFLVKPFLGYGTGTFEYPFRKHYKGSIYTKHAHSSLLKIAVETGLLGLLSFLFYISGIIFAVIKHLKIDGKMFFIIISVISGFLFSILNVSFEVPAYVILFFLLSSTVFVMQKFRNTANKRVLLQYVILFVVSAALILSFFFTSKSVLAEKLIQNGTTYAENGFLNDAYNSYRDASDLMPEINEGLTKSTSILIQLYNNEGDLQKKEAFKKQLLLNLKLLENNRDKDSEVFFVIGITHNVLGNKDKAEEFMEIARFYYPASTFYAFETAKTYFINNKLEKTYDAIRSIDQYMPNYLKYGHILHGLYLYKLKDLESAVEYQKGRYDIALKIAEENLINAKSNKFNISKAREQIKEEQLISILNNRVLFYKRIMNGKQLN